MGKVTGAVKREWSWLFTGQRSVLLVAAMVVGIDAILGLLHIVAMVGWDAPNVLRVDMDGSYAEAYQYVKYFWVVILLTLFAVARRSWSLAAWIPLFVYFLADDALLVHELAGYAFSLQPWSFGVGPVSAQTIGELGVSAIALLVLGLPIVLAYARADAKTRMIHLSLVVLVVVMLVFAVVIDFAHSFFIDIRILDRAMGFVEDFGEMLVLSAIVVYLMRVNLEATRLASARTATVDAVMPGQLRRRIAQV
ncbi:hypothetical protein [Microbacterium yannicii]|uniref:hypothetical protein n=1 Tax=Microbacterium yannicii TaxID=671622 RepID=UPI0012FAB3D3|nr:hypothetical protein [Microbacterium yannicii]